MVKRTHFLGIIGVFLPFFALAEPLSPQVTTINGKKFYPLAQARSDRTHIQKGVRIIQPRASFALRRDRDQLGKGGLRFDRAALTPNTPQRSLLVPDNPVEQKAAKPDAAQSANLAELAEASPELEVESEELESAQAGDNPVLALFGEGPISATSFREALGAATGTIGARVMRHARWPIPLSARQYISSGFGARNDPFTGRPSFHGGLDIAADEGTPVLASADGQVTEVKEDANFGKYIGISHADGTLSRYGHLSTQHVRVGARVKAGDVIGGVGNTGRSTGPHLDYRISKNDIRFDPLQVLSIPRTVVASGGAPRKNATSSRAVPVHAGTRTASNALPRQPMVIRVR